MRKLVVRSLIVALAFGLAPVNVLTVAAHAAPAMAIRGVATGADGTPLACGSVRLRDLDTGAVVDTARIAADGTFAFPAAVSGDHLVEAVDASSRVIGSAVVEGARVDVAAPAVSCATTQFGAAAAQGSAAGGAGLSTAAVTGIVVASAAAIGIATWLIVRDDASPSQ